jgi:hypothetical protein
MQEPKLADSAHKHELDLTGLTLDLGRGERLSLNGILDAASLADKMIEEWIPYFECHRCGRFDYCKFVQRLPNFPHKARDIKCGVVVSALRIFVNRTFPILQGLDPGKRQAYLDAAYHLTQLLFDAETMIGMYMSDDYMEESRYAPLYYGRGIVQLRDRLNSIAEYLCQIPQFESQRAILFVEGWSEKAFLDKLRESGAWWFISLLIEVYGGRGNRRPGRIEMLLENYVSLGYRIFIQGDADGHNHDIFQEIVRKGMVSKDHAFIFDYDFETSVPLSLLFLALQQLGELEGETLDIFENKVRGLGAVGERIKKEYRLDLAPLKKSWQHRLPTSSIIETDGGRIRSFSTQN